jgi:hypothetical protein
MSDEQTTILGRKLSSASICRLNGWFRGTHLVGDEGYGPTVIEITAVGERCVLAKAISYAGVPESSPRESSWDLSCRDWEVVPRD